MFVIHFKFNEHHDNIDFVLCAVTTQPCFKIETCLTNK